jgi:hypothetical protein
MPHTPGPWRAQLNSILRDVVIGPEGDTLAEVLSPADPDQSSHSNTTLIAAAPDLLAALSECVVWLDAMDAANEAALTLRDARRAIFKAEWRQP